MDERPKTLEIGDKCPGRIGEWLGWEIVNRYVDEEGIDLATLMQNLKRPGDFHAVKV